MPRVFVAFMVLMIGDLVIAALLFGTVIFKMMIVVVVVPTGGKNQGNGENDNTQHGRKRASACEKASVNIANHRANVTTARTRRPVKADRMFAYLVSAWPGIILRRAPGVRAPGGWEALMRQQ